MKVRSLIAALAVLTLTAGTASAGRYSYSGNTCLPDRYTNKWDYGIHGYQNVDPYSAANVICPVYQNGYSDEPMNDYSVYYWDRNPYPGETINGYFVVINITAVIWSSGSKFSCGTPGGCSGYSPNQFTGNGFLQWQNPFPQASNIAQMFSGFYLPRDLNPGQDSGSALEYCSIGY